MASFSSAGAPDPSASSTADRDGPMLPPASDGSAAPAASVEELSAGERPVAATRGPEASEADATTEGPKDGEDGDGDLDLPASPDDTLTDARAELVRDRIEGIMKEYGLAPLGQAVVGAHLRRIGEPSYDRFRGWWIAKLNGRRVAPADPRQSGAWCAVFPTPAQWFAVAWFQWAAVRWCKNGALAVAAGCPEHVPNLRARPFWDDARDVFPWIAEVMSWNVIYTQSNERTRNATCVPIVDRRGGCESFRNDVERKDLTSEPLRCNRDVCSRRWVAEVSKDWNGTSFK